MCKGCEEREREREWNIQRSFPWQPLPREIADPRALQNKRGTDCRSHMAPAILSGLIWLDLCVINCAGKLVYTAAYLIKRLYNNGRVYGDSMKWPIKSSWRQMNVLSIGGEQERPRSMWYPDEQGDLRAKWWPSRFVSLFKSQTSGTSLILTV